MATETNTDTTTRNAPLIPHETQKSLLRKALYGLSALLLVFLWIPLVVMIFLSFGVNSSTIFPFEGFTLANYAATFADAGLVESVIRSIHIATYAATIATVLGVLASFALARYDFPYKEFYRTFGILPMLIPGVVFGIALLIYFSTIGQVELGFWTVVLTHSVYGFPFVLLIVTARMYTYDTSLEEAARDLGADPLTTFRDVTLPIVAPAIGAGFLFAWIRSFEDFIRAFFVRGNLDVLTTAMYGMIKYGAAPKLNAISSAIVFVVAVVLAVAMNLGNVTQYVAGTQEED